ncbi:GNAT family N-acetyltransferase [Sphingosinicella sp. BN140058]|uniref:GNAT family N-acetyltransferase n=1 Tax=Sphingosinicella sp. BN140058 TaxID=1892855 RepID=UPI00101380A2|nr:GNAT family N-acetyltransferase [Sphingosinicella sp. BN140058]QAY79155.1 GNAT family N-acetyltransferase [Sphingosinicella sp. BN140058]
MTAEVELFDAWDAVASAAGGTLDARRSLFARLAWFRLLARHCPPPGALLAARSGGTWLFLARNGRRASAYANWYSLRFGAIGSADGIAAIARKLRSVRLASIEMTPIEDPAPLAAAFRAAGWIVFVAPATTSWRIETTGLSFRDYWASRPSRLRNTAERRAKAIETRIYRRFDDEAWRAYEEIYRASWKPEEGSPAFLRALAEQEGDRLRLGLAFHQGRPVAAQFWLIENGIATIHKLAYREDARQLSPGTVLSMAMFRAALDEDRVEAIDYGTGDEPYKSDWMDTRRLLWRIEAFSPSTASGLGGAARRLVSDLVRRGVRR